MNIIDTIRDRAAELSARRLLPGSSWGEKIVGPLQETNDRAVRMLADGWAIEDGLGINYAGAGVYEGPHICVMGRGRWHRRRVLIIGVPPAGPGRGWA